MENINESTKQEEHDPLESGKKAIEADKIINKKHEPDEQKDKEEKEDAEKWRNEG